MQWHSDSHERWLKTLPASEMVYPEDLTYRIKYYFWRVYGPYHPVLRDSVTNWNIIKNRGRQPYLLGTIAASCSIEEFVSHLVAHGYAYHRIAWIDDGEVVSLRYVENFIYQYHIRVFEDGEVRGHYEYTPECYPFLHLLNIGHEDRREEFLKIFGDRIIPSTSDDPFDFRWEFLPLLEYLLPQELLAKEDPDVPNRSNTDQK